MSDETVNPKWSRIYVDIPPDLVAAAAVEAAKLRMSKKDFYALAIREKVDSLTGNAAPAAKPKSRKGSK